MLYPDPIPISPKQVLKFLQELQHFLVSNNFLLYPQIARFRQLQDTQDGALVDNFRQLQSIGNRRVFMRNGNNKHAFVEALKKELDYKKWDWYN